MKEISRNDPCHCGSGKKFKKCCADKKGLQKHQLKVLSSGASTDKTRKLSSNLFQPKPIAENTES